jgi:hypothetical protein
VSLDNCLTDAKHLDREGLDDVIRMLRNALLAALWHEATFAGWHGPRRGSRIADHAKRFSEKSE